MGGAFEIADYPQCAGCGRFRAASGGRPRCEAYPGGIPDDLWNNKADHRFAFAGDGGLLWTPLRPGGKHVRDEVRETLEAFERSQRERDVEPPADTPPKKIHIAAEYGTTYAWDEEGSAILLAPEWPDIPELPEIEEELVAWADTYGREMARNPDGYDWAAYSRRGRIIAVKLARALRSKGVPVLFETDEQPLTGEEILTPEPLTDPATGEPVALLPPREHRVERWTPDTDEGPSVPEDWLFAPRHDLPGYAIKGRIARFIRKAIETESEIVITYQGGTSPGKRRRIAPKRLFVVEGYAAAYLQAYDCDIKEERTFRLDRIERCGTDFAALDMAEIHVLMELKPDDILPEDSPFVLTVGETEVGWCGFEVRFGERTWRCEASYIAAYPLSPLVYAAVELPQYFRDNCHADTDDDDVDVWDCLAADEPGGIVLRVIPLIGRADRRVRIQVFRYRGGDMWPRPDKCPDIPPEAEGTITLDAFARAVYKAAAHALARQGITRLSLGWESRLLTLDFNTMVVFPVDRFLHLHYQLQGAKRDEPSAGGTLAEDVAILQQILQWGEGADTPMTPL